MGASNIPIGEDYLPSMTISELEEIRDNEPEQRYRNVTTSAIMRKNHYNITQISAELGVSAATVKIWLTKMAIRGVGDDYKVRLGRPAKFTSEQLDELEEDMRQEPHNLGLKGSRWTSSVVSQHVANKFGIYVTPGSMRRLMLRESVHWPGSAEAMRSAEEALDDADE